MVTRILVGTHHKTGTVWMQQTFSEIAKALRLEFVDVTHGKPPKKGHVFFHEDSDFAAALFAGDFRGLHVIRDPRDVVISGLRYHRDSDEKWLHLPDEALGGMSYQEMLWLLRDEEDQFEFELHRKAKHTIEQLMAWNYNDPRFFEARYEDLMADRKGEYFGSILRHLGIDPMSAAAATAIFQRKSIAGKPIPGEHRPALWSMRHSLVP